MESPEVCVIASTSSHPPAQHLRKRGSHNRQQQQAHNNYTLQSTILSLHVYSFVSPYNFYLGDKSLTFHIAFVYTPHFGKSFP